MISNNDFKAIAELDLDPIKVKLMHKESGEGWTLDYANQMEFEYRRFLYLMKMFPNEQTAPLFDVDIFWHYHILDTMKYAVDCEQVFGYFLHHFPYVGLRGEDDEAAHVQLGAHMQELYEDTFGEPYVRDAQQSAASAWSSSAPAMKTAWSSSAPEPKAAWSSAAPELKTAWSSAAPELKTAWSSSAPAMKTAWSSSAPAMKTAWSSSAPAMKTAWSSVTRPAAAGNALDRFYSERPTLAVAA